MISPLLSAILLAAAAQDDALLPTHLVDGGQVFTTATVRYIGGKGDATLLGSNGSFDQSIVQFQLDAGIGLGMGFEIDASLFYQILGETRADFPAANVEFDSEDRGFSDLVLDARYRILKDDTAVPQLIIGALVVAPVGNDKKGRPEIKLGGTTTQTQEESGIGQGVWHYGVHAGISKKLAVVEPYLTTSYVFGDKRTENGVREDRADVWSLTLGAQWHLTPQATLDTRAVFSRPGVDKQESNGSQTKEESHFTYTGQIALHVRLGGAATLVFGGGVVFVEDHEINDLIQLNLKDDYAWFINLGLHILVGGK